MKRPAGVKSLAEIRQRSQSEDRVPAYATLLEFILRNLASDGSSAKLNELIEIHAERFRNVKRVYFANAVRNDLPHAGGQYAPADWDKAGTIFDEAIVSVIEFLPISDRHEILRQQRPGWTTLDYRKATDDFGESSTPVEANFRLLYLTGNVVWPDEVAKAEKYPFTDDAAHQFLSRFESNTILFDPEIKSIYLRFAKSNLPHHSYADGYLYAQTINELREGEKWPEPLADIRLECGGPLEGPVVKVTRRIKAHNRADYRSRANEETIHPPTEEHRREQDVSYLRDSKVAVETVCPNCGAQGWFEWKFLGKLTHSSCNHTWYAGSGMYAMMQFRAALGAGPKLSRHLISGVSGKDAWIGKAFGWFLGFLLGIGVRLELGILMIPIQAIVGLCHPGRGGASGIASRAAVLTLSILAVGFAVYEDGFGAQSGLAPHTAQSSTSISAQSAGNSVPLVSPTATILGKWYPKDVPRVFEVGLEFIAGGEVRIVPYRYFPDNPTVLSPDTADKRNWSLIGTERLQIGGTSYPILQLTGKELVLDSGNGSRYVFSRDSGRLMTFNSDLQRVPVKPIDTTVIVRHESTGFITIEATVALVATSSQGWFDIVDAGEGEDQRRLLCREYPPVQLGDRVRITYDPNVPSELQGPKGTAAYMHGVIVTLAIVRSIP